MEKEPTLMSPEEQKITEYLNKEFSPEAMLLIGSHLSGSATADSDWDVLLFCGEQRPGVIAEHDGLKIDVVFSAWPNKDSYLDTQFGPVYPTKALFDRSAGKLESVLKNTEEAYNKGPRVLQKEQCESHLKWLDRHLEKLGKHNSNKEAQFYYKGKLYELFLEVWFEQQNRWMPSPVQALQIIREDSKISELLDNFISSSGTESATLAQDITRYLRSLGSSEG